MKTRTRTGLLMGAGLLMASGMAAANNSVHTTYLWHLQQPIYWPDRSLDDPNRYQMAWESMTDSGDPNHPESDLASIFSKADRIQVYQYSIAECLQATSSYADMGAQVTYPGDLIENIGSLAENGWNYASDWNSSYSQARNWSTSGGQPRLDLVAFDFHHSLAPLVDEASLHKELQIHKAIYPQTWGANPGFSKGYFPSEQAFSERLIETLAEEGIEWVIVSASHVSRACEDYPFDSAQDNTVPPNAADQVNGEQGDYYSMSISRGITTKEAYPFAYEPHMARYVNPSTGAESKIILIPMAQGMSWQDGYAPYSTEDIDAVAGSNDSSHPMLIVLGHDGDNAYAGGWSYYHSDTPNFVSHAASQGYSPTTIQQYLEDHPVSSSDVIHIEDGAWVNADGDFGAPQYINWLWPPTDTSGNIDVENGWGEDFRNWAVMVAAQHRAIHAEAIDGEARAAHILEPNASSTDAERAWHFVLPGLTSGYMYYGSAADMEVKPTVAANEGMVHADAAIGGGGVDNTAPTVFIPQRHPYNPGGYCAGALCGYQLTPQSKDFYVWTFVYDTNDVSSVVLKVREDNDGVNPLSNDQNEVYDRSSGVSEWRSLSMTVRPGEDFADNIFNNSEINFDEMPTYIADEYYAEVTGYSEVLLDYYVEATDTRGNVRKSPIQHVYVGDQNGQQQSSVVSADPDPAIPGEDLTLTYDANEGSLPVSASQITLHWGYDGWQEVTDSSMSKTSSVGVWTVTVTVPVTAESTVDFVFTDGSSWDNNGGADYHVDVDVNGTPTPTPTPDNHEPIADAGEDQTLPEGDILVLDGRGSEDPDGDTLSYLWSQNGEEVGTTAMVQVADLTAGSYVFELEVNDGELFDTDYVNVEVEACSGNCCAELDDVMPRRGWMLVVGPALLLMGMRRRNKGSDPDY